MGWLSAFLCAVVLICMVMRRSIWLGYWGKCDAGFAKELKAACDKAGLDCGKASHATL